MSPRRPKLNAGQLRALEEESALLAPILDFPWHTQQEWALTSNTDIVQVNGGNQSGKSQSGIGIAARLVRREGPVYQRLKDPVGRQMTIWVAPKVLEKYFEIWEPRCFDFIFAGFGDAKSQKPRRFSYRQSPYPLFEWYDDYGGGKLVGKAQKQGFMAFESDAVDLIIFDEEPEDPRILSSAKARFATTNGVLVLTFTPLLGMSFTYHDYYAPTVKDEFKVADRVWRRGNAITVIEMGMADNPASVAGGGVARIMRDPTMSDAEKNSRLYGKYGFTEGLLFPNFVEVGIHPDRDPYFIDHLPGYPGRPYEWVLTADPNKRHGALLTALDSHGNRFYCQEHYGTSLPDSQHALAYHEMLRVWNLTHDDVQVWADPGGAGAQAIINLAEGGIYASPVLKDPGSVAASIKRLRGATYIDPGHAHPVTGKKGAPRVYFLRFDPATGRGLRSRWRAGDTHFEESRLCFEFRQYRQKRSEAGLPVAPDTPVKENDDLVDPARYVELVRAAAEPDEVPDPRVVARARLDPLSRREAEEVAQLEERLKQQWEDQRAGAAARFVAQRMDPNNYLW